MRPRGPCEEREVVLDAPLVGAVHAVGRDRHRAGPLLVVDEGEDRARLLRRQVEDQQLARRREPADHLAPRRRAVIEHQRALAGVEGEVERAAVDVRAVLWEGGHASRFPAARRIDLNHGAAEVGEALGGGRGRHRPPDLDHAQARERLLHSPSRPRAVSGDG